QRGAEIRGSGRGRKDVAREGEGDAAVERLVASAARAAHLEGRVAADVDDVRIGGLPGSAGGRRSDEDLLPVPEDLVLVGGRRPTARASFPCAPANRRWRRCS